MIGLLRISGFVIRIFTHISLSSFDSAHNGVFCQSLHNTAMTRPGIIFLTGQRVAKCTHVIDKHFSDYCTLQHMTSGDVALRIDREQFALNGRWFWSAYPGPRVAFRACVEGKTWSHRYVAFRGDLVERWRSDGLFPIRPQAVSKAQYVLTRRFDDVIALTGTHDTWAQVRAGHVLEGILIELAYARRSHVSIARTPAWAVTAQQLLSQSPAPVDYVAIAETLGMSPRTLRRNFVQYFGISPHQHVINQRVRHAKQLLTNDDTPVKEIALRLGYTDVFYFGRQFKHIVGVSPARFRRTREN